MTLLNRVCSEGLMKRLSQPTGRPIILSGRLILLLAVIAIPLIEIAVLIKVGQIIGVFPTILIVIGTAVLGVINLQRLGFGVMARAREAVAAGRTPLEPVMDATFLVIASLLLISPGIIADIIGLILLIPLLRHIIARWLFRTFAESVNLRVMVFGSGPRPADERAQRESEAGRGVIIDAEYKRLDDGESDDRRKR